MIKKECKIILFGNNKNTIEMTKNAGPPKRLLSLGDSSRPNPWTPYLGIPWKEISDKSIQGCNMAFTLNPDIRVDFDVYGKVCIDKLLEVVWKLKCDNILKKIICVNEYGQNKDKSTKSPEDGKLHFHGFVKVTNRQTFEKAMLKTFNKRCQLSHRTLQTKLFRQVEDRTRYYNYMKKEQQNQDKCLIAM